MVQGTPTPGAAAPSATPAPSVTIDPGWTRARLIAAALFVIGGILATFGAWHDIYNITMRDEESSHIALVPLLAIWLAWIRRNELLRISPTSSLMGPILVSIGWAVSHWGFYGAKQSPWHFGAVIVLVGCFTTILGVRVLRAVWPAILVLVFLVPVPGMVRQQISIPLERATASVTTCILAFAHFPIARSGNQILINKVPVLVAEACNGLRMIFPLFLIVYVFCFTLPLRIGVRALLLLTSPLSAVVCNVLRLLPTVLLFGYASKRTADIFHEYSGWPMVTIAFLALMGVINILQRLGLPLMQKHVATHEKGATTQP